MKTSATRTARLLASGALVSLGLLAILLFPAAVSHAEINGQADRCNGTYYTVRRGDSWSIISRRVDVPIAELRQANPQARRRNDVVYAGERLCIPSRQETPQAEATLTQRETPKAQASPTEVQEGGVWYRVRRGDTWSSVARAHGLTVRELQEANPKAQNRREWLYVGQRLWIPAFGEATPEATMPAAGAITTTTEATVTTAVIAPALAATTTVTVEATAGAAVTPLVTEATGTPTTRAQPLPTATSTPGPLASSTPMPTAAATNTPTKVPTVAATNTSTPMPTAAATNTPTKVPTLAATNTPIPVPAVAATSAPATAPAATAEALPPVPKDCPKTLADFGDAMLTYLNDPNNTPETLQASLVACRALAPGEQGVVVAPITAPSSEDVVVTVTDPAAKPPLQKGLLLVYHEDGARYRLARQIRGTGRIALLKAADINADKKFDLAYSDTSCGAHTCFATLSVVSWDGSAYRDWIAGEPTMAGPEYTFKDVSAEGQGEEIMVHGGVINSVGAGPQRAWTETYISPKGAEYELLSREYDASTCLYHQILDANAAFDAWTQDGFDRAIELYKAALANTKAEACGTIKDEIATLQDFARFRLIVASIAAGYPKDAAAYAPAIKHPGLRGAANGFLLSYGASGSVIQACRNTTALAKNDTSMWDFLADWGYANPSLTAEELCPLN